MATHTQQAYEAFDAALHHADRVALRTSEAQNTEARMIVDLANAVRATAYGLEFLAVAVRDVYEKLEMLDRRFNVR
jgi:hypothetical protein